MQNFILKVDDEQNHLRLDIYLTKNLSDIPSRSFIKRLIDDGHVTVNEQKAKAHQKVLAGDEVAVQIPDLKVDETLKPENIPLDVVYEDEVILIINKQTGMLVHPVNANNTTGTLVNALLYYCQKLSDVSLAIRPGIVHRLDRETSGLILVAKDNKAHTKLAKQFEKHSIKKQYMALVEGNIEFDEGVIDVPLSRHPRHYDRKSPSFSDDAKEAKTFYRVIKQGKGMTVVRLFPQTGRTHQLRVHLAYLGHPVLGDDKYGRKDTFSRLALHAQGLGFLHPMSNEYVEFSIKPPKEFITYLS